jgi:hypothetical protein
MKPLALAIKINLSFSPIVTKILNKRYVYNIDTAFNVFQEIKILIEDKMLENWRNKNEKP